MPYHGTQWNRQGLCDSAPTDRVNQASANAECAIRLRGLRRGPTFMMVGEACAQTDQRRHYDHAVEAEKRMPRSGAGSSSLLQRKFLASANADERVNTGSAE
jgi:hypothetical protein